MDGYLRPKKKKKSMSSEILNDTIEQLDLIDVFRMLHLKK